MTAARLLWILASLFLALDLAGSIVMVWTLRSGVDHATSQTTRIDFAWVYAFLAITTALLVWCVTRLVSLVRRGPLQAREQ